MRVLGTLTISDPLPDETIILISPPSSSRGIFKFRAKLYCVKDFKILIIASAKCFRDIYIFCFYNSRLNGIIGI